MNRPDVKRPAVSQSWRVARHGEPADVLELVDAASPELLDETVLIEVEATNVNFADILQCRGEYQERPALPFTPGVEACGRVVDAGSSTHCSVGDRVLGMTAGGAGGFGHHALLSDLSVLRVPDEVPPRVATVLYTTYQTGHVGLHHRAGLQAGETLLVHGASGGVGSAAVQLGLAAGATVIATAGGPEKVEFVRSLGAHHVIDTATADVREQVRALTDGAGVNVAYDAVGGDLGEMTRRLMAWEGRLLVIGFAGGGVPTYPANHMLVKNYSVIGFYWGSYLSEAGRPVVEAAHDDILAMYSSGQLVPPAIEAVPLADLVSALERVRRREVSGRLVVVPELTV